MMLPGGIFLTLTRYANAASASAKHASSLGANTIPGVVVGHYIGLDPNKANRSLEMMR